MTYLGYKDDGSFPQFVLNGKQVDEDQYQPTTLQRGKRIFLPNFHNTRYVGTYIRNELRTIAEYGNPDIMLGVGCNPQWPDVTRHLEEYNLEITNSDDIVLKVFKCKLDGIVKDVADVSWVVDFQDYELPGAYVFVYLEDNSKFQTIQDTDNVITAEIPDVSSEPELHGVIKEFMIAVRFKSNEFPKPFADATTIVIDGTFIYKRRNNGIVVVKDEVMYDNGSVICYNKSLSLRYHTYLSVESCVQEVDVLRWLCRQLYNRASVPSGYEYIWEKLGFPKTFQTVDVVQVGLHLPDSFVNCLPITAFLSLMEFNRFTPQTRHLTYTQFGSKYVWDLDNRRWIPRRNGKALARLPTVSSCCGELYYLRVLLDKVVGPRSFEDILTVDGEVCGNFKEACIRKGLVEDWST